MSGAGVSWRNPERQRRIVNEAIRRRDPEPVEGENRITRSSDSIPFQEGLKCRSSVAIPGFLFRGDLGKGLVQLGEVEQRIIAESLVSSGHGEQLALDLPGKDVKNQTYPCGRNHAYKFAPSVRLRQLSKLPEQGAIVIFIIGVLMKIRTALHTGRVTGGMHSWSSIQGV